MAAKRGNYSNIIVYDERRRYYYINPQKNKPLLDDEIRDMGIGLLDQVRRAMQSTYGDVAAPYVEYAASTLHSTVDAFKVRQATDNDRNFIVTGGASLDHPAVLFAKGYYIFLTGDLEYKLQQYPSDTIDIQTQTDKSLTITPIPALTTPTVDRIDVVYVDLHFEEVTAVSGTDVGVYRDTGLKNPVVGTETANRLRAVIDIKVKEGWTSTITKDIFDDPFFLGEILPNESDPIGDHYKIPIAVIYRDAFSNLINDSQIVDLLSLYNKRAMSLAELSYRVRNGGYTETGLYEAGLSGFQSQYPVGARYDEGAFATGYNKGLGTEALNTNSVTPRILDNDGKFFMRGLMVGHYTGIVAYETGPESLGAGEMIAQDLSVHSLYAGYGETGITGMREYKDSVSVVVRGETGRGGLSVMNMDGVTGSKTMYIRAVHGGEQQNFVTVDYAGRVGLNTDTPGWDKPLGWENTDRYNDGLHGETGVNVVQEINGSLRLSDHVFADGDVYVGRDAYGQSWKIPAALSDRSPALFGFTGIPQGAFTGIPNSIAAIVFKRGIAVMGDTGILGYGYTGMGAAGQYECFDSDGKRMFTIGDLGDDFNRTVMTLYGTSTRKTFTSDVSLLDVHDGVTSLGPIQAGDQISYDIVLVEGTHITNILTITALTPSACVEQVRQDILTNSDFPNGYTRSGFDYIFYETDGTPTLRHDGYAEGVVILSDPFGSAVYGPLDDGKLILKDMPEDPVKVELDEVALFTVTRPLNPTVSIAFTQGAYYGGVGYGGSVANVKFAKLDLGEGADGWLINGDVFFNGNGLANRVTFSPNAMFRNDVFIYGTLFSDQQFFNLARIQNLFVDKNVNISGHAEIDGGLALGVNSWKALQDLLRTYPDLLLYVGGKLLSNSIVVRDTSNAATTLGTIKQTSTREVNVSAQIGGTVDGSGVPYGIHLIDNRSSSVSPFTEMVIDASDGRGTPRTASLRIKGDLTTENYFSANYLSAGNATPNASYKFQVNGDALINNTLTVKELRFIGASSPEGTQDIQTPQNITVIGALPAGGKGESVDNNQIILREKKFTSNGVININNAGTLGDLTVGEGAQDYYQNNIKPNFDNPTEAPNTRWAFDNVSYTEDQFNEIVTNTGNEILVSNITIAKYQKFSCERITIATLGTLNVQWAGYKFSPSDTSVSMIQSYYLTSPYFRNSSGGQTIDWFSGSSHSGDDNIVVRVTGDIVDTSVIYPNLYKVDQPLCLYIPKDNWWQYHLDNATTGYTSFALFYPYENVISGLNIGSFDRQVVPYPEGVPTPAWKVAVCPRLIQQNRTPTGTNLDKLYTGQWDLDLVILPEGAGRCADLVGKLYVSYVQG